MIEPIHVSREDFPKSNAFVEGMKRLRPVCDNYELKYLVDINYITRDTTKLYLQIILPINPEKPVPLIIFVPGSAFHKQNVKERVPQLAMLAMKGYAVALLEYRPADDAPFPAQVLDVKAGILYMRKHADTYNVDPKRIVVMGDSSGAYTALMAGVTNGVSELEEDKAASEMTKVRAIIDFFGPTNIATMNEALSSQDHRTPDSPEGYLIGQKPVLENPDLVYPTVVKNYVSKEQKLPPILIFHGSNDELVPFEQSCELYTALVDAKQDVTFYQIEDAHHGDRQFWSSEVLELIDQFIKRV